MTPRSVLLWLVLQDHCPGGEVITSREELRGSYSIIYSQVVLVTQSKMGALVAGVTGPVLGLVGLMSVYCGWVRWQV